MCIYTQIYTHLHRRQLICNGSSSAAAVAAAAVARDAAVGRLQIFFLLSLLLECAPTGADYYTTLGVGRQATPQQIRVRLPHLV